MLAVIVGIFVAFTIAYQADKPLTKKEFKQKIEQEVNIKEIKKDDECWRQPAPPATCTPMKMSI